MSKKKNKKNDPPIEIKEGGCYGIIISHPGYPASYLIGVVKRVTRLELTLISFLQRFNNAPVGDVVSYYSDRSNIYSVTFYMDFYCKY